MPTVPSLYFCKISLLINLEHRKCHRFIQLIKSHTNEVLVQKPWKFTILLLKKKAAGIF